MQTIKLLIPLAMLVCSLHAGTDYKTDSKIGEGSFKTMIRSLKVAGDRVYALEGNGNVQIFNATSGAREVQFETGLANTHALALDDKGQIHVFATLTVDKEFTRRNKKYTRQVPAGVSAKVFDAQGKELRTVKFDDMMSAKAAEFIDGTLVVADLQQRKLIFLDATTGKKKGEKGGLRLCCGIFDFCKGPDKTVGVSNLGAFQLQQFDLQGTLIKGFGKRGKELDDFHGCCNPVSASYLPDGNIVTVEKSPTRIKIYDAEGKNARLIEGVEELVKGCSHIPVAVDAKGNVFLANSPKGYLVKCVPKT